MPATPLSLSDALKALGKAVPLVANNYTTVGGWTALGATEGPITVSGIGSAEVNALTAREHTGGLVHQATVLPGSPVINIPVLPGVAALWDTISPTGSADGYADNPPAVATKALWLVPLSAWNGIASIGYDGATWTPADSPTRVENAILFMKGFFSFDDVVHQFDEGGKAPLTVHFTAMYDSAAPAGKRAFIRGNPVAKGLTTFRV
jgi:hypothetical protein